VHRHAPEILHVEGLTPAEDDALLDTVLELAHVSRPLVADEEIQRARREPPHRAAVARRELRQEMIGEERDVLRPLAQGRDRDVDHGDPVVEIGAEGPASHRLPEVAVRGRDEADVHPPEAAVADPAEVLELEHAQELRLKRQAELADLVDEERAGVARAISSLPVPFSP
jgi:hypothetical protein